MNLQQKNREGKPFSESYSATSFQDYIKICPEETEEIEAGDHREGEEDMKGGRSAGNRFTFNRISQDVIKEEVEEFYKVDYDQIIELKTKINAYQAENARLVHESAQNIQLFNSNMQEMEQRLIEKNGEIESLRFKLKNVEEKYVKCEEQLKKLEMKVFSDLNVKGPMSGENRQRSAHEIRPVFRLSRAENAQRTFRKLEKGEGIGDSKDIQIRVLEKENHQIHRDILQLKENHHNLAKSFEKELQLRKVEEQYDQARNVYYRTLNNSPRVSLKPKNKSIINDHLRLQLSNNTSLNALVSPRNNCKIPLSFFQPNPAPKTGRTDHLPSVPKDKAVSRSTYLNDNTVLHFGKEERGRYTRQDKKF